MPLAGCPRRPRHCHAVGWRLRQVMEGEEGEGEDEVVEDGEDKEPQQ